MDICTFLAATRYMVATDFGAIGTEGLTHDSFNDACDTYSERMDAGEKSRVFSIEFVAGRITDITEEAALMIAKRCNDHYIDFPAWLDEALEARAA